MDDYYIYVPLAVGALAILVAVFHALGLMKRSPGNATMIDISAAIQSGARAFLRRYSSRLAYLSAVVFGLFFVAGRIWHDSGLKWRACMAFLIGVICSALAVRAGVWFSTRAGSRATESARTDGIKGALNVARGVGAVASLIAIGLAILGLCAAWSIAFGNRHQITILAAFALGSSIAALVVRVSGGIHAASCHIGSDIIAGSHDEFAQDDLRNPAAIVNHVGDHLSGIAGMCADIMDSLIAAVVAAMLLATFFHLHPRIAILPLLLVSAGLFCTMIGLAFIRVFARNDPRRALIDGAWATTVLFVLAAAGIIHQVGDIRTTPSIYGAAGSMIAIGKWRVLAAVLTGVVAGRLIAISSDYFTSIRYRPTRGVALASQSGPVLASIQAQRAGMMSCIGPAIVLAAAILVAHGQAGLFGIALAAVGIVATLGMSAALIACAPIADTARGISEMARLDRSVREITDILDAVGGNIAAIGRGLSSGVAALATAALIAAFATAHGRLGIPQILHIASGLLIGGAMPWLIAGQINGAVGASVSALLAESRRQFLEIPGIAEGKGAPDYAQAGEIAARRSISAALAVALLVIALPIAVGGFFGLSMLAGMLAGALVGGLMLGSQSVNTGSALGHSKKFIEEGLLGGEGSDAHDAARIGDQIGDALKNAVGPAMNTVIKLLAILALLIVPLLREWSK